MFFFNEIINYKKKPFIIFWLKIKSPLMFKFKTGKK